MQVLPALGSVTLANIPSATASHMAAAQFGSREEYSAPVYHKARVSHNGQALRLLDRGKYSFLSGGAGEGVHSVQQ